MKAINVISGKGGVGCTATASVIALSLAERGHRVLITGTEDVASILGAPSISDEVRVAPFIKGELFYSRVEQGDYEFVVRDIGKGELPSDGLPVICYANDYMALKNILPILENLRSTEREFRLVGIIQKDRALNEDDCASVVRDDETFWINHDPSISRAHDAGLLATRFPHLYNGLADFISTTSQEVV